MVRLATGAAFCALMACRVALAGSVSSTVAMEGAQEVGPVVTTGHGDVSVDLDLVTRNVLVSGSYADMLANVTLAHLHDGLPGVIGPPVVTLAHTAGTAGTISGSQILTATQAVDLIYGRWYANVHTTVNPGGEIRGQVFPSGLLLTSMFGMDPSQEVPPAVGSTGLGTGMVTLDTGTDTLSVDVSYSGLTGAATLAHIHAGGPGAIGSPIVTLNSFIDEPGVAGTGTVIATIPNIRSALTDQQILDLLNGQTYLNVHTASFPGGEIRGAVVAVPEPGTLALLAVGAAIGLRLRRRRV